MKGITRSRLLYRKKENNQCTVDSTLMHCVCILVKDANLVAECSCRDLSKR